MDKINIERPTLVVDKERAQRNIRKMLEKAQKSTVLFRPHFKTHQSAGVGEWFKDYGIASIAVSSVDMAIYFAQSSWKDITIAFPVNIREIAKINTLASQMNLNLLVESVESIDFLIKNLKYPVGVWIKIDVGYGRAGVPWHNIDYIVILAKKIQESKKLYFCGLLTHAGHTYYAKSVKEIRQIHRDSVSNLTKIKNKLLETGINQIKLSIGDTPSCSLVNDFSGVDEIRPGNFIFYDLRQLSIGSCTEDEIAVRVACPVVAKHRERNEVIIYGGAAHLSKDFMMRDDGTKIFGYVSPITGDGWGPLLYNCYVASVSQDHGIIKTDKLYFEKIKIGDILLIAPVHSCLAANLLKDFITLEGEIIRR